MDSIKQFIKEKHIMSKFAFCVIFILIYAFLLSFKNVPYIEFMVTEEERVLKEDSKLKINYNVDEDIQHITATYKETILNQEGIVLDKVEVVGDYDKTTLGEYPVKLRAEHDGFVYEEDVIIWVRDLMRPVIALEGERFMKLTAGEAYVEPGFSATDNHDGDVTDQVVVHGTVRPNGRTYLKYEVTDSNGNTRVVKRRIDVEIPEGQKVIYLTFDDGPSEYTGALLEVLDTYDAKATFFITNGDGAYHDRIGEAYKKGHTIGVHSFSHDVSEVYSSTKAFYDDLQWIQNLAVIQTGVVPNIVRFPYGTGNTISEQYEKGIMSDLTSTIHMHNYTYCDWNVNSDDCAEAQTEAEVVSNVIDGIKALDSEESPIVLLHDVNKHTVDAVDDIIEWGQANGYLFLPLVEDSPFVQQEVKN